MATLAISIDNSPDPKPARWPEGKRFAFTIIDDTDWCFLDTTRPVYDLLAECGLRTTKTVWIRGGSPTATNSGATCEDPFYLHWLWQLQQQGFEIAFHNAAPSSSTRPEILAALDEFRTLFGTDPAIHCNHVGCRDNLYWGADRLTDWRRAVYNVATLGRNADLSEGHIPESIHFWGDLARQRITYTRSFVFPGLNALSMCPMLPYHDPQKPFVNFWFPSTDCGSLEDFLHVLTPKNIDRLERDQGLAILYVHFGRRFCRDLRVHPGVEAAIRHVASRNGWFVPASTILNVLRGGAEPSQRVLTPKQRAALEARWLFSKLRSGGVS